LAQQLFSPPQQLFSPPQQLFSPPQQLPPQQPSWQHAPFLQQQESVPQQEPSQVQLGQAQSSPQQHAAWACASWQQECVHAACG
jgi:hypothetical protein